MFRARDGFSGNLHGSGCTTARVVGDNATYVIHAHINYTNICSFKCQFCAFSKGKTSEALRGKPSFAVDRRDSPARGRSRARASDRGLHAGRHSSRLTGIPISNCRAANRRRPDIHIHAFSPLESSRARRRWAVAARFPFPRSRLPALGTLPGNGPPRSSTTRLRRPLFARTRSYQDLFEVMRTAHRLGITALPRSCSDMSIAYNMARHLLRSAGDCKPTAGGSPNSCRCRFVHMEAAIFLKGDPLGSGLPRGDPDACDRRLVLHPLLPISRRPGSRWAAMAARTVCRTAPMISEER